MATQLAGRDRNSNLLNAEARRRLAGHLFQDRWKYQGRGFILLPPWPPNCLGQMLTVRDFSQHLVSSSKTIRPNIPRGARCMGHCEMMWSAVCSLAPHSQFARGARPHLYMDEQKRPTPERRRLSLTQAALGRPIPKGLELALGMKAWSDNALAEYSMRFNISINKVLTYRIFSKWKHKTLSGDTTLSSEEASQRWQVPGHI